MGSSLVRCAASGVSGATERDMCTNMSSSALYTRSFDDYIHEVLASNKESTLDTNIPTRKTGYQYVKCVPTCQTVHSVLSPFRRLHPRGLSS